MEDRIDTAPCLYWSFSDERTIVEINQTLCNTLGYEKAALQGGSIDGIFSLASRIFFQTHWFPLLKLKGGVDELFISLLAKDKTSLPVLVNSNRKVTNDVIITECVAMVVRNRTKYEDELLAARKAYEAALSTNAALAEAKEKLFRHSEELERSYSHLAIQHEELRQMNKIVTHDLQEPVRKLLFYSEQLKEQTTDLPEGIVKNIERLRSVTIKLSMVVSGLQQYVWLTELKSPFVAVDMNEILAGAVGKLKKKLDIVSFNVHSDPLPTIHGNSEQLAAMLTHILDNAVRFRKSGEDPMIHITSTIVEQNKFRHLSSTYRYTDYIRISIKDNGRGIPTMLQGQVFDLFYSFDNPEGAGLGLAISKKVAEYHQGTIKLESEPGNGTTVVLTLPLEPNRLLYIDGIADLYPKK